jgi:hypothetical protein
VIPRIAPTANKRNIWLVSTPRIGLGIVVFAIVVGWSAFLFSARPASPYLRNFSVAPCDSIAMREPGFDPWTGVPHGWTYSCTDRDGRVANYEGPMPADLSARTAVPVPVGFTSAAIVGAILLWLRQRFVPTKPDVAP